MAQPSKDPIRVTIFTTRHRIEGTMHVFKGGRLTDTLNAKTMDFYPVTDAEIRSLDDDALVATTDYTAVARDEIVMVYPTQGA